MYYFCNSFLVSSLISGIAWIARHFKPTFDRGVNIFVNGLKTTAKHSRVANRVHQITLYTMKKITY